MVVICGTIVEQLPKKYVGHLSVECQSMYCDYCPFSEFKKPLYW